MPIKEILTFILFWSDWGKGHLLGKLYRDILTFLFRRERQLSFMFLGCGPSVVTREVSVSIQVHHCGWFFPSIMLSGLSGVGKLVARWAVSKMRVVYSNVELKSLTQHNFLTQTVMLQCFSPCFFSFQILHFKMYSLYFFIFIIFDQKLTVKSETEPNGQVLFKVY